MFERIRGRRTTMAVLLAVVVVLGGLVVMTARPARACAESVSRIAFVQGHPECSVAVWTMESDGTGAVKVSDDYSDVSRPMWSFDHTKLVFAAAGGPSLDIFVIDADGTNLHRLTDDAFLDDAPSFSPDGSHIIFSSDRSGPTELWVMGVDGSSPTRLTDLGAVATSPSYSPDGTHIVFTSTVDGGSAVFVMAADGTGIVRLTEAAGGTAVQPSWSPDGTRIAYASGAPRPRIWTMDPDGTDPQIFDNVCVADRTPTWSPDGARIVYARTDGEVTLWSRSVADPNDQVQLRAVPGSSVFAPTWGRVVATSSTTSTSIAALANDEARPAFTC